MMLGLFASLFTAVLAFTPAPLEGLETKYPYVDGILVMQGGKVVYEQGREHNYARLMKGRPGMYNYTDPAWHPYYEGLHTVQSISKTVTAALIGVAIQRGEIPNVDVPVSSYLKGVPPTLRLRHLLTMTAGLAWNEDGPYKDPRNDWAELERSFDWIKFIVSKPLESEPGKRFNYSSGVAVLLGEVLRRATGQPADAYAVQHLFKPLGCQSLYWKKAPMGVVDTQGGLYLKPLDLARFGQLYLQDGMWEGRRLLPAGWVKTSTSPLVSVPDTQDWKFGYQWWLLPCGNGYAWTALGYGGQRLFVLPQYDAVAVFTGWNVYDEHYLPAAQALERVVQSVR